MESESLFDHTDNLVEQHKFAVICASNQNRSMEAHEVLQKKGFHISSYGTAERVKLPGPSISQPNIYPFGTPYRVIYEELKAKDSKLYSRNGILELLERNMRIKEAPEKFQESAESDANDVILTCEERCFDAVCEELRDKRPPTGKPVHVINLDIKDNPEDAAIGARLWLQLCMKLEGLEDLEEGIEQVLEEFQDRTGRELLHTVI
jgi:RNA polymerase II subunit A C-terminal domain phosphatase SSU72